MPKSNGSFIDSPPSGAPYLRKGRAWRACESCRRKKIKCDGNEPVCGQCTHSSSPCTWLQTKDRAATSRQYVQELEGRLLQMEGLLAQANIHSDPSTDGSPSTPLRLLFDRAGSSSSSGPPSPSSNSPHAIAPLAERISIPPAPDPKLYGQYARDGRGIMRWIGGSSAVMLVEALRNMCQPSSSIKPTSSASGVAPHIGVPFETTAKLYFPSTLYPHETERVPTYTNEIDYPSRGLSDQLIAAYFTHIHPTLPVLDSNSFRFQYRRLMDETRPSTLVDTGFTALLFAVFACAARVVDDPRLQDGQRGFNNVEASPVHAYYERSMTLYQKDRGGPQMTHVQTLVLISSFLASIDDLPQSWLIAGQALRLAQDLGLHRSPKHLSISPIEKETRRKVWWCVYGLDRMMALILGRPLGIDDSDCDVELPLNLDDVDLPAHFASANSNSSLDDPVQRVTLMKGFNALSSLWIMASQIIRSVYKIKETQGMPESQQTSEIPSSVNRLDALLTKWCEDLPSVFKSNPQNLQQMSLGAILCSAYYAVKMILHQPFLPTSPAALAAPRPSSVGRAVTVSRSYIHQAKSTKNALPPTHWLAFFSQYLFSSAVIILVCIIHATDRQAFLTAINEVDCAVEALQSLETSWPGAKKYKELLSGLVALASHAQTLDSHGTARRSNSNASIRDSLAQNARTTLAIKASNIGLPPIKTNAKSFIPQQTMMSDPRLAQSPAYRSGAVLLHFPGEEPFFASGSALDGSPTQASVNSPQQPIEVPPFQYQHPPFDIPSEHRPSFDFDALSRDGALSSLVTGTSGPTDPTSEAILRLLEGASDEFSLPTSTRSPFGLPQANLILNPETFHPEPFASLSPFSSLMLEDHVFGFDSSSAPTTASDSASFDLDFSGFAFPLSSTLDSAHDVNAFPSEGEDVFGPI